MVRAMTIEDYEEVYALWNSIEGFGMLFFVDMMADADVFTMCV